MYLVLYLKHFERFWVIHMLKKDFHKRLVKGAKMFLKKKKWKAQYAHKRYRNLSEEEKEKKCQYGCERYKNFLEK